METQEIRKIVAVWAKLMDTYMPGLKYNLGKNPVICFSDIGTAYRVAVNADDSDFRQYDPAAHDEFISKFSHPVSNSDLDLVKSLFERTVSSEMFFAVVPILKFVVTCNDNEDLLKRLDWGLSKENIQFCIDNHHLVADRIHFFQGVTFVLTEGL